MFLASHQSILEYDQFWILNITFLIFFQLLRTEKTNMKFTTNITYVTFNIQISSYFKIDWWDAKDCHLHKLFRNNSGFKCPHVKTFIPNWSYIKIYSWISCIFWSESAMSSSSKTYIFLQMDIHTFWIWISFITAWTLEAFKFSFWIFKAP